MKKLPVFFTAFLLAFVTMQPVSMAANIGYINVGSVNVDYLTSYGHTVFDLYDPVGLTLSDLSGFDAVLIASSTHFTDRATIGNVVKDFADAGGGVVLAEFCFQGGWALTGGIMGTGYSPFTADPSSSGYYMPESLGTVYVPSSPLFNGVNPSNVSTRYQANVGLDPGAILVADWASGRSAIAYNSLASSSVVGLNQFPRDIYTNSDTRMLISNAINFSTSSNTAVPEPSALTLLCLGWIGLAAYRRKRR